MQHAKYKSGEAMTFALVGLLIGSIMLYINTGNTAQMMANREKRTVDQWEVIADDPGGSAATVLLPAVGGWGVGYILDEATGKGKNSSQDNQVNVSNNEGPVNINITGNPSTSTDTETDTTTTTSTDNSTRN